MELGTEVAQVILAENALWPLLVRGDIGLPRSRDRSPAARLDFNDKWVSPSEAARIRDVSPQAIGRLVNKGRFRTLRIGGRVLLDRSEVENYKPRRKGRPRKGTHSTG